MEVGWTEALQILVQMPYCLMGSHGRLFNGSAHRQYHQVRLQRLQRPLPCRYHRCYVSCTLAGKASYALTCTQLRPQQLDARSPAISPTVIHCRRRRLVSPLATSTPVTCFHLPLLILTIPHPLQPEAFYRSTYQPWLLLRQCLLAMRLQVHCLLPRLRYVIRRTVVSPRRSLLTLPIRHSHWRWNLIITFTTVTVLSSITITPTTTTIRPEPIINMLPSSLSFQPMLANSILMHLLASICTIRRWPNPRHHPQSTTLQHGTPIDLWIQMTSGFVYKKVYSFQRRLSLVWLRVWIDVDLLDRCSSTVCVNCFLFQFTWIPLTGHAFLPTQPPNSSRCVFK